MQHEHTCLIFPSKLQMLETMNLSYDAHNHSGVMIQFMLNLFFDAQDHSILKYFSIDDR